MSLQRGPQQSNRETSFGNRSRQRTQTDSHRWIDPVCEYPGFHDGHAAGAGFRA